LILGDKILRKKAAKDVIELNGGEKISGSFYENRKCHRWRTQALKKPRTLPLFRLLLCFFQAQIFFTLSLPFVAADPVDVLVNNVVDQHGDIMVSTYLPCISV
jgi:hypothetical protein